MRTKGINSAFTAAIDIPAQKASGETLSSLDTEKEHIEGGRRLTFDMSGGLPTAQPAVRRPLDGGVGHQEARFQLTCTRHNLNPPPFERRAYFASTRLSKTSLQLKDFHPNL
jgi:hypothetical protein